MKSIWLRLLLLCLLSVASRGASAAITCTVSSSGFTSVYSPTVATANDSQGSFTVSCLRTDLANDPTTLNYTLQANDGANAQGGKNYARNGAGNSNRVEYELYRDAAYAGVWGATTATAFSGTVNFGSALTAAASHTQTFYARIPALQNVTAKTFPDTVTVTLCSATGVCAGTPYGAIGLLAVAVITTTSCQLSTPPANMSFSYTSFQIGASLATTGYAVRCTNGVSYRATLDATSGSLLGLNYTLSLGTPGSVNANGLPQNHTINGSIAGGQSGACATGTCANSQQRVLTITY